MSTLRIFCALVAFWLVPGETWSAHTDDGCAVETHCTVCLLKLRTTAEPALAFSLPPVVALSPLSVPTPFPSPEDETPRDLPSRGPPLA
jgi:hypothetical protein